MKEITNIIIDESGISFIHNGERQKYTMEDVEHLYNTNIYNSYLNEFLANNTSGEAKRYFEFTSNAAKSAIQLFEHALLSKYNKNQIEEIKNMAILEIKKQIQNNTVVEFFQDRVNKNKHLNNEKTSLTEILKDNMNLCERFNKS